MQFCAFSNAAKWDESKHKRAKDGKFAKTAGEGSGKAEPASLPDVGSVANPNRGRKWEQKYDISDSLKKAVDSVADKLSDKERKAVQDNIEKLSRAGTPERAQAKAELVRNLLKRKGIEVDEKDLVKSLDKKPAENPAAEATQADAANTGENVSFVDAPDAYSHDKYLAPPLFGSGIPRGTPMNHVQADELKANPKYMKEAGYAQNCQLCVPAYELRRRGYNVEAKSSADKVAQELATTSYWTDVRGDADNRIRFPWQRPDGEPQKPFYLDHITNDLMQDGGKLLRKEMRKSLTEKAAKIEAMVKSNAGARFAMTYYYGNVTKKQLALSGHTVTLLKGKDGVTVYDPQNGQTTTLEKWAKSIENSGGGAMCCVTRIDNARINPRYEFGFSKAATEVSTAAAPKATEIPVSAEMQERITKMSDAELGKAIMDINRQPREQRDTVLRKALVDERGRRQGAAYEEHVAQLKERAQREDAAKKAESAKAAEETAQAKHSSTNAGLLARIDELYSKRSLTSAEKRELRMLESARKARGL